VYSRRSGFPSLCYPCAIRVSIRECLRRICFWSRAHDENFTIVILECEFHPLYIGCSQTILAWSNSCAAVSSFE
jgi:hypothetical protein